MTKSTSSAVQILKVIVFVLLNLQRSFVLAEADAHHQGKTDTISTPKNSSSWIYGKYLIDPISFSGSELRPVTSIRSLDGSIFQGTTTYGRTGRWVGRAYPVYKKLSSEVVSASMTVLGGVTNPAVYNPYGTNPGVSSTRRPTSRPSPPFIPPRNIFVPYGTPHYFSRFHPFFNRPAVPNFNYVPVGHVRRYNRLGNRHVLYREVDPSYLIFGANGGSRAYFLEENSASSVLTKRKTKEEDFFSSTNTESVNNISEVQASTQEKVTPAKQLFSIFSQDEFKPKYTAIAPEPLTPAPNRLSQQNSLNFIPITFVKTTSKPKSQTHLTFGSFTPKPTEPPTTSFVPFNFLSQTPSKIDTFAFTSFTPAESSEEPNLPLGEIDIEDIDRSISDIIRIIPARRRGNTTRNNRGNQFPHPPTTPNSNPEGFPGLHPAAAAPPPPSPPPPRFPEHLPPDTPEIDDEGWTIIRPRFRGTIQRTPINEPPGRLPDMSDVEFFIDTPATRKPNKPVIDKSFNFGSEEKKPKETSVEELITPGPSEEPKASGKAFSGETTDEGNSTTSLHDPFSKHEEILNNSPLITTFCVITITVAMTTGSLLTNYWLLQ